MMDEKLDRLLAEITEIKDGMNKASQSWLEKLLHILEKLILPIAIAGLAWLGSHAATKISEGQLALAQSAADDRKSEFRRSMQAKYIEIFYKELNSGDQASQLNAIRLVRLADSELAQNLLSLVASTPNVSETVKAKANEAQREIEILRPLSGYKVGIYFLGNDPASVRSASQVQARLQDAGLSGTLQLYPSDSSFFQKVAAPASLEVRFWSQELRTMQLTFSSRCSRWASRPAAL